MSFDLKCQVDAVMDEIQVFKWLESEKCGHDIGFEKATRIWIESHYDDWFAHNAGRFCQ